jgi:hypothetical protein
MKEKVKEAIVYAILAGLFIVGMVVGSAIASTEDMRGVKTLAFETSIQPGWRTYCHPSNKHLTGTPDTQVLECFSIEKRTVLPFLTTCILDARQDMVQLHCAGKQ